MDYLTNDDVLLEIFLRLPAKSLHRVKCVSKRWHSLISDPCFARSFIRKHPFINILFFKVESSIHYKIESVLGLPLHDDMTKVSSSMSNSLLPLSFDFIPALQLNRYKYHNNCSLKGVTEKVLVDMDLRGNCAGLVLLRAVFQDRTDVLPFYKSWRYYIYYLCNPITKQWIELPSISTCDLVGFTCYYLPQEGTRIWADTGYNIIKHNVNYNPNKIEYTVVSINKYEHDDVLIIRVFSSTDETSEWKSFRVPCPRVYKSRDTFTSYRVLFSNGKFHWTGGTCIVAYDPFNEPEKCDIIPLPPMDPPIIDARNVFLTNDGRIRVGTPLYTGKCSVWELADYDNKLWVKKYDLNVKVDHPSQSFPLFVGAVISPLFFVGAAIAGEKAYVVARHLKNTIMVLDMRNASLQHVYTYYSNSVNRIDEDSFIYNLESYISSPWPTTVPLLQRK